jgi:hypothetical protein
MNCFNKLAALLMIVLLAPFAALAEPVECAPGLADAAQSYRLVLQAEQYEIRDSLEADPRGVVPTSVFDLVSHSCHSVTGQAYRIYGIARCRPQKEELRATVRYPFNLFYRRESREKTLFEQDWEEGSDGLWQVTFERTGKGWETAGQKEVLDLTSNPDKSHKGPPGVKPDAQ